MNKQRRYSRQRDLLLRALSETKEHPTAETLYFKLRETNPRISLGTVYRNLNLLSEEKTIYRMNFPVERYDYNTAPHPHFICSGCGGVSDLSWNAGVSLECFINSGSNEIIRYDIICTGICETCILKATPHNSLRRLVENL